jgi:hypothetical protein
LIINHQGRIRFVSAATGARREIVVKDWPILNGIDWKADGHSILSGSITPDGGSVILEIDMQGNVRVLLESDPHVSKRARR